MREAFMAALPWIVKYFGAILLQLFLLTAFVFETMQMNTDALLIQRYQFIKKIKIAAMINRVGYVE